MPHVRRVGVLFNPLTPAWKGYPEALSGAARLLGLELVRAEAPGIAQVEHAFAAMAAQGVDAVFSPSDPTLVSSAQVPRPILDLIARHRLPAVSDVPSLARAGGLLSLGADLPAIARRSAGYVRHILEGARPHDLPVQRPAGFTLIVNLKAAEALGIQIPLSILARADEVIE
jgi:putative ABC transport system substrate-binding protein